MDLQQLLQNIIDRPLGAILIVANLILIESLLSVDNAAVIATMVMDLPKYKRKKALKYGIIGAYLFRGVALLLASYLVKFWFLKPLGGLYLLYLVWDWWLEKMKDDEVEADIKKHDKWIYKKISRLISNFWATVIMVELMDVAFSIDNVFAAVAFSNNILLIWLGVFIGILAMRFVAQIFVDLMERYPFLETCAFIVIGILGVKLLCSISGHIYPESAISLFLDSREADWITSAFTISVFILPFLIRLLFYHPQKNNDLEI